MLYFKRIRKILVIVCALFLFFNVETAYASEGEELYLGGFPAGFILNTKRVEVVGVCDVITESGLTSPARDVGIRTGDLIDSINGEKVSGVNSINELINRDYKNYTITYDRNGKLLSQNINPVIEKSTGLKKLGMLIKDTVTGVGTVTYVNKANSTFASLGHPVNSLDGNIIDIYDGKVYKGIVYGVKKGLKGSPGELKGIIDNSSQLGNATLNSQCGVFGKCNDDLDYNNLIPIKKASIDCVEMGKAFVYTTINGQKPEKYEICIVKIDAINKDNRNFVIKINDERLIEATGGIVQGMSGSPIVQNDRLIGAITHVFINDPTRGYGIAIDNMLN